MTNGEPIVVRAAMKPISTLMRPIASVDFATRQPFDATKERSDVCALCLSREEVGTVVCCLPHLCNWQPYPHPQPDQ